MRLPFERFQSAVTQPKRLGRPSGSHISNEPRGFRNPKNRIDMYQRLEAFFANHPGTCGGE